MTDLTLRWFTSPGDVPASLRHELTACWRDVGDAALAGWAALSRNPDPVVAHWGGSPRCRPPWTLTAPVSDVP